MESVEKELQEEEAQLIDKKEEVLYKGYCKRDDGTVFGTLYKNNCLEALGRRNLKNIMV